MIPLELSIFNTLNSGKKQGFGNFIMSIVEEQKTQQFVFTGTDKKKENEYICAVRVSKDLTEEMKDKFQRIVLNINS